MSKSIKEYIQKLSDEDMKEVLLQIVSSSSNARNIFLTYCRTKFPEDGEKLKTDRIIKLFKKAKQVLEYWDEDDFGYYDYKIDDNVDYNGNTFTEVVRDIGDAFDSLYDALTEDDIHISDNVKKELTEYLFSNLYCWEGNLEEVFYRIAGALCYTKEEELSLASDILKDNSHSGYKIAYQILEKNNEVLKLIELKKSRVYSAQDAYTLIDEYIKLGRDDFAAEYAVVLVNNKNRNLFDRSDSYTDRICEIAYKSFDTEHLFSIYRSTLPAHLKDLILSKAEEAGNEDLYMQIISDFITRGDPEKTIMYYTRLKSTFPDKAIELYKSMEKDKSALYAELSFAEENYSYLFDLLEQHIESIKYGRTRKMFIFDYIDIVNYDRYAKRLEDIEPRRVYEYYWKNAEILTDLMGRDNYHSAVSYLRLAYKLNEKANIDEWKSRFTAFMEKNRSKRLIKDIVKTDAKDLC